MPPVESERALKPGDAEKLATWIAEGAEYEPHWAYIPPERPDLPEVSQPELVRNAIDQFVLAGHEAKGLEPAPEADKVTLIRRLSFDLRGLPPTPEEVHAFLEDESPEAYEKVVDEYLASDHFGERMAVDWLDQVRYADTNGFHGDEFRSVWPYRDYVIQSFNENKPFDQFTVEQIAGDLIPGATREQKIAAAYNRLNQLTAEGGAQAKEYLAKYAADRVRTTTSVWMGATMGCAECHDHKFDPYSIKDFYSFAAFFADINEVGVYGAGQDWAPILKLPNDEQETKVAELDAAIAKAEAELTADTPERQAQMAAWEDGLRSAITAYENDWTSLRPAAISAANGTVLTRLDDGSLLASGPNPAKEVYELTLPTRQQGITGFRLEVLPHESMPNGLSRGNGNFVLTEFDAIIRDSAGNERELAFAGVDASQAQEPDYAAEKAIDGDNNTGWAADGYNKDGGRTAVFKLAEPCSPEEGETLIIRLRHESSHAEHIIGRFEIAMTTMAQPGLGAPYVQDDELENVLWMATGARNEEQRNKLTTMFREHSAVLKPIRDELARLRDERAVLEEAIPYILATESVEPRTMRVLPRGNWLDESGEVVEPDTPEFLPGLNVKDRRATRLDLANWIVSRENPLTARVQMNRTWDMFFGIGVSKVLDDLGNQGEWPTHPELLSWLAVEFMDSGWDMKHMVKLMVTSSTYRQASTPTDQHRNIDPYNRYLARQSRFRLEAEMVRDNALAVSGLLAKNIGGPSVFPYQPDGYWDNCNTFRGPLIYTASEGDDQYRRGLYTVWKRSFLHPSMLAFDAPTREECTADRVESNTPLQALVLLNDPSYVEAARVFAENILIQCNGDTNQRLDWAFMRALSRAPRDTERTVLTQLLATHLEQYRADEAAAEKLVSTGHMPAPENIPDADLAAWTNVARVILNLHETITRS
jgi:hypothetical protein